MRHYATRDCCPTVNCADRARASNLFRKPYKHANVRRPIELCMRVPKEVASQLGRDCASTFFVGEKTAALAGLPINKRPARHRLRQSVTSSNMHLVTLRAGSHSVLFLAPERARG